MPLVRFRAPGNLEDLPPASPFHDSWHDLVAGLIKTRTSPSGSGEYVDPSRVDVAPSETRAYTWTGFPRPLLMQNRDDRRAALEEGEDRDVQIEYLEWHVQRDDDGSIVKVTFSTETPEYWLLLAEVAPERVVALYRELVDPDVEEADLFPDGSYAPRNRWNTTDGIVHYVMRINSMKDLLGVSQETTRPDVLDGYGALPYGRATGADARINMDIWTMTRKALTVATDAPPGLYMVDWDDTGWTRPDGSAVGSYWTVVRGTPGAALRVTYEVPPEEGFVVGDIRIGGRRIEFGGQIAEHITMAAHAVAGAER